MLRKKFFVRVLYTNMIINAINPYISFTAKERSAQELEFLKFRRDLARKVHPQTVNYYKDLWNFSTNSTAENEAKLNASSKNYMDCYCNKASYALLKKLLKGGVEDKNLKRKLKKFEEDFRPEKSGKATEIVTQTTEISAKLNNYKFKIDGEEKSLAEIHDILATSEDSALRKKAREAHVKFSNLIAKDLIKLVKTRNEYARSKGYDNFFEYELKNTYNVDPKKIQEMFEQLSDAAIGFCLRENNGNKQKLVFDDDPEKLVNNYIKDKETIVATGKEIYKKMGWDLDKLPVTLDLFPRAGKETHGFCVATDNNKDVRAILNLGKNLTDLENLSHELGHVVYYLGISDKLQYFDRDCPSCATTEAVAMMMGHIFIKEDVLPELLGVPQELIQRIKEREVEDNAAFVRKYAYHFNFEKSLYENPDKDPAQTERELAIKYLDRDPNLKASNKWATTSHYLTSPGYLQNYLRAEIMGMQLYEAAVKQLGPLTKNPHTADYFNKKLFRTGAMYDEEETLKRFTGEGFSIDTYKKQFEKN